MAEGSDIEIQEPRRSESPAMVEDMVPASTGESPRGGSLLGRIWRGLRGETGPDPKPKYESLEVGDAVGMFDALIEAQAKEADSENVDLHRDDTNGRARRLLDSPAVSQWFPGADSIKIDEGRTILSGRYKESSAQHREVTLEELRAKMADVKERAGIKQEIKV